MNEYQFFGRVVVQVNSRGECIATGIAGAMECVNGRATEPEDFMLRVYPSGGAPSERWDIFFRGFQNRMAVLDAPLNFRLGADL